MRTTPGKTDLHGRLKNLTVEEFQKKYPGMYFAPSGDRVVYRHREIESIGLAKEILKLYYSAKNDGGEGGGSDK